MKKLFVMLFVITGLFLFLPQSSFAQGMMGNYNNNSSSSSQTEQQYQQNLQNLVNDLLNSQNVSTVNQLNCKKVNDGQFEKIGDAWMDVAIGNKAMHQVMDNRLGGEGSDSLKQSHIQMGENYLGCTTNGTTYSWMPMMQGFQNTATGGGVFSMMGLGYGNYTMMSGAFGLMGSLVYIVVLVDLILLGIWLWKQIGSDKRK